MKAKFDLVVVGAGPAGLAAARAAAQGGMTIAVVDDNPRAGGQIWRQGPGVAMPGALRESLADLIGRANVTFYNGAKISALNDLGEMIIESAASGGMSISFGQLIIASGARERLLPFAGWTLPGVTGAGALQALIKGGMPVRGERVVLAGSGPLLIAALATARAAGANVIACVEQAPWRAIASFGISLGATPSKAWQAMRLTRGFAGTRYWADSVVTQALGDDRVEAAVVRRGGRDVKLECDRIACGYGLVPNVSLAQMAGCALARGAVEVDDLQRTSVRGIWAAGECTGIGGMELARAEGEIAGLAACGRPVPAQLIRERDRWRRFAQRVARAFELGARARAWPSAETILCRCEDVAFGDVSAHATWRDAKLHTRCGMGPCQGRICGAAVQTYFGWDAAMPRPPLAPTGIGALLEAQSQSKNDARL
ncbi:NAD(P)/FAD-dependent oxidoreductase [Trinickia dinghuensis]|uniref:NAD(P)/FAD-dependent oxidoreductase n=1 Tax=Trinickia dinghuensis TaxID=2291023 RepID=A0A3D8JTG2_9BURK|nr:FAD/NAD(P)-binding oxidoreductase [Trinickia dinghuensis]RDU96348.1 NAD(P)/FAD-dependent oxidoreductase [Trinickia dinghuensis]